MSCASSAFYSSYFGSLSVLEFYSFESFPFYISESFQFNICIGKSIKIYTKLSSWAWALAHLVWNINKILESRPNTQEILWKWRHLLLTQRGYLLYETPPPFSPNQTKYKDDSPIMAAPRPNLVISKKKVSLSAWKSSGLNWQVGRARLNLPEPSKGQNTP